MKKIKKYQVGGQFYTPDYLTRNTIKDTTGWLGTELKADNKMTAFSGINPIPQKMQSLGMQKVVPNTELKGINTNTLKSGAVAAPKGGFGNFMKSNIGSVGTGALGAGLGLIGSPIDNQTTAGQVVDTAANIASSIPVPGAQIAGLALKGVSALNRALGKTSKKQATAGATATGYDLATNKNAGKKYGLFGGKKRRRTNRLSERYDRENIQKIAASFDATKDLQAASASAQDLAARSSQQLQGGINTNTILARKGAKLEKEDNAVNVIPEGALHARKHNLDVDDITNKGIPVVSYEDGDKITQHAEIEVNEIILHIELTKQLEALLVKFDEAETKKEKDDIAIEAGKILTTELLDNTDDKTGLINTI